MIRLLRPSEEKSCQLCGQGPLARFEIPGSSVLWRCDSCELYQDGRVVGEEAYADDYHFGYARRRAQKLRTARVRLGRIASVCRISQPRMLEIGCSVGCTLEAAEELGWDAQGVDVSDHAVEVCQERGLNAHKVGPLDLPFSDNSFDVLASWHVIEHVEDVRETLQEWRRVLRPGGLLVLETPDASCAKVRRLGNRYRKFWAPEHTYTFTPANLSSFFADAGFRLVRKPVFGELHRMKTGDAVYATVYQTYHGLRKLAGVNKAFQLFAEKTE